MRNLYEIQKDIDRTSILLNRLILEKKLTINIMAGHEVSAKIQTEKLIERCKENCGK